MTEQPLWIDFFRKLRPSYIPPSRYRIASAYLDSQYAEMQNDITSQLKDSKTLHLQCDGWSNIRNESIINIVISKPEPLFVEFISTKEKRHNAPYLADLIIKTIEKYGPEKFLVVIGDNAANMQSALNIVKEKFPKIIPLGCLAHLLHLLCGDILGCATVKSFMATAVDLVKTVKNSHLLKAIFDRLQSEKKFKDRISLKLPGNTRWGSHLFCLQSLHVNKSVLQKLAVSEEADISPDLKRRILDDAVFWVRVEKMIKIMNPIIELITIFEGNNEMIHKVYVKLKDLEETLTKEILLSPLQKAEENKVMKNLTKRMKRGISSIHLAGDLLNPSSQGCHLQPEELLDAIGFICETGESMGLKTIDIQKDMADYRDKEGLWKRSFIWEGVTGKVEKDKQVAPLLWWRQLRGTCVLADVAIRILGAPITSAATERTFSTFSWIHSKRRNRLTTARASKITYISHNWHLLNQQKTPKPKPKKTKRKPSAGPSQQVEDEDEEEEDEPHPLDELSSNDSSLESEDETLEALELETKDISSESD